MKNSLISILILLIIVTIIPVSFAEEINITPDDNIQESVDKLNDGGQLTLTPGEYRENGIIINKNITINGQNATINSQHGNQSIFQVTPGQTVTFNQIKFINANSSQSGGAIYADTSNLIVNQCAFINNTAERFGAGIYIDNGTLKLNNSIFINNIANYDGGAIAITRKPGNLVENSIFINNTAPNGWGGTFYNWYCDMEINNITITGGLAETGGAIFNAGDLILTNSHLYNNTATESGGALYNYANSAILQNNTIHDNYAIKGSDISLFRTTKKTNLNNNWWGINNPINNTNYPQEWNKRFQTDYDQTINNPETWINLKTTIKPEELTITTENTGNQEQTGLKTNVIVNYNNKTENLNLNTGKTVIKTNNITTNITTTLNYQKITNTINTTLYPVLNVKNLEKTYNEDKNYTGSLTNNNNQPLINQTIILEITRKTNQQSKNYTVITNNQGEYTIPINLAPGQYTITNYYNGNNTHPEASVKTINLTVNKINTTLKTENFTSKFNEGKYFTATLKDNQNQTLTNQIITLTLIQNQRTKQYNLNTDNNGEVKLQINLAPGQYKIETAYQGTNIYQANNNENTIIVQK